MAPLTIWTIGHSTRTIEEFTALLRAHRIGLLVDVRSHPGSRKFPWFGSAALASALREAGIDYLHAPELGGRRRPRPDSRNTAWRSDSFRGYADYMGTPAFSAGLAKLRDEAARRRAAIMCSEAVWWRCHRGLISDALKAGGATVLHIEGEGPAKEHPYTSAAKLVDGRLSYGGGGLFDITP